MRLWIALVTALVLSACAAAQAPPDQIQDNDPLIALAKFTRADVVRGRDIAAKNGDTAGVACSEAILAHIPEGGTMADMLTPTGVFSAYMFGREIHRSFKGIGVPEDVHIACAPLLIDAQMVAIRLGIIAAGAGALPNLPGPLVPNTSGFGR